MTMPSQKTTMTNTDSQPRSFGRLAALLIAALLVPAVASAAVAAEPRLFQLDSLNGTYSMDGSDIEPVRQGPITIHLSSPANSLVIRSNSLELDPVGDGTYRSSVAVDFLGKGDLVARFETDAGTSSQLEDELVVPRQTLRLDGRVKFRRVPLGWEVTALELPAEAQIRINSRLANSLLTLCGQLSAFLGFDCDGLDASLSQVRVNLPEPGSIFLLEEADLTPDEARLLDSYLGF